MKRDVSEHAAAAGGKLTAAPLGEAAALASPPAAVRPEFVGLPKPGTRCPWTGLSRSKLNELILPSASNGYRPPVVSKMLRHPGRVRGIRLIVLAGLLSHLREFPDAADPREPRPALLDQQPAGKEQEP